jgi:hypothetical protein
MKSRPRGAYLFRELPEGLYQPCSTVRDGPALFHRRIELRVDGVMIVLGMGALMALEIDEAFCCIQAHARLGEEPLEQGSPRSTPRRGDFILVGGQMVPPMTLLPHSSITAGASCRGARPPPARTMVPSATTCAVAADCRRATDGPPPRGAPPGLPEGAQARSRVGVALRATRSLALRRAQAAVTVLRARWAWEWHTRMRGRSLRPSADAGGQRRSSCLLHHVPGGK